MSNTRFIIDRKFACLIENVGISYTGIKDVRLT